MMFLAFARPTIFLRSDSEKPLNDIGSFDRSIFGDPFTAGALAPATPPASLGSLLLAPPTLALLSEVYGVDEVDAFAVTAPAIPSPRFSSCFLIAVFIKLERPTRSPGLSMLS